MKYKLFIILFICLSEITTAQDIFYTSDHIQNAYLFNPARAGNNLQIETDSNSTGIKDIGNIFLSYRDIWLNSPGRIGNLSASVEGPVSKRIGLGGIFYHERANILHRTGVVLTYAFRAVDKKKGKLHHRFSLGINASYLNQRINIDSDKVWDTDDPELINNTWNRNFFSAGLGISYQLKNLFAFDLSVNNIIPNSKGPKTSLFFSVRGGNNITDWLTIEGHISSYVRFKLPWQLNPGVTLTLVPNQKISPWLGAEFQIHFTDSDLDISFAERGLSYSAYFGFRVLERYAITMYADIPHLQDEGGYTFGFQANYRFTPKTRK